jgi:hypothetical protein
MLTIFRASAVTFVALSGSGRLRSTQPLATAHGRELVAR